MDRGKPTQQAVQLAAQGWRLYRWLPTTSTNTTESVVPLCHNSTAIPHQSLAGECAEKVCTMQQHSSTECQCVMPLFKWNRFFIKIWSGLSHCHLLARTNSYQSVPPSTPLLSCLPSLQAICILPCCCMRAFTVMFSKWYWGFSGGAMEQGR